MISMLLTFLFAMGMPEQVSLREQWEANLSDHERNVRNRVVVSLREALDQDARAYNSVCGRLDRQKRFEERQDEFDALVAQFDARFQPGGQTSWYVDRRAEGCEREEHFETYMEDWKRALARARSNLSEVER